MKLDLTSGRPAEVAADALIVPLFEGEKPGDGLLGDLDRAAEGAIARAIDLGEAKGKLHHVAVVLPARGLGARRLVLVGAGKAADFDAERARTVAGAGVKTLRRRSAGKVAICLRGDLSPEALGRAAAEGALIAEFDPGLYRSRKRSDEEGGEDAGKVEEVILVEPDGGKADATRRGLDQGRIVGEALSWARTLSNAPGNLLYPMDLANEARKLGEDGVEVEVLEAPRLKELSMGGILGVGGGSDHPPALALMRYRGAGDGPFLGLVGKGVTFDSGGISIKPAQDMHEMKSDMAGAAAVVGAMRAIARLKPRVNVLGVIACVENLPSSHSYRPGDVLTTHSGKTIEVLNTDAEGRVILSDAVAYAVEQGANRLVDAATLTGAAIVALGTVATAVLGRPQGWVDRVLDAAKAAGEKMWQLPIYDEYKEQLKSQVADIANTGGRAAGTITGGLFIGFFVEESVPWVHLDIAGTDSTSKDLPWAVKGPLGTPLRTFVELALMEAK